MTFCLNPGCTSPDNPRDREYCQGCGAELFNSSRSYTFKDYHVIGLLEHNQFTTIYLAEDPEHNLCAIKKLQAIASASDLATIKKRFFQEAQKLYQLNHPQIPQLLSYFELNNYFYLIEYLVKGQNLKQEFEKQGYFNQEKIKTLLDSLLPVLLYLQEHNVVHQNIQPENIIRRDYDQSLILVNFSVNTVKIVSDSQIIIPNYNREYAAPEQIRGRPLHQSDLYSLGVTFMRLLTGCLDAGSLDLIYDDYNDCWTWSEYLSSKNIKIKPELVKILNKMLASPLNSRYQSAQEIINDLNLFSPPKMSQWVSSSPKFNIKKYCKYLLLISIVVIYLILGWLNLVSFKITPLEAILTILTGCSILTVIELERTNKENLDKIEKLTQENQHLFNQNLKLNFDNRILSKQKKEFLEEAVILKEEFNDPNLGWIIGKSQGIEKYIADSRYYFQINKYDQKNYMYFSWIDLPQLPANYNIELKTIFIEGEREGWYGLIMGTDEQNYYLFRISRYGYSRVSLFKQGKWKQAAGEMCKINCDDEMILNLTIRDNRHFNYYVSPGVTNQQAQCVGVGKLEINCSKIGMFVSVKQKDKKIAFDHLHITGTPITVQAEESHQNSGMINN